MEIRLRGTLKPECWNPYTGKISEISSYQQTEEEGTTYTKFELSLPQVSSVFIVSNIKLKQK
ncbi:hypothetical protein EZS27_007142 [termite gut metagenome]|uniref:Uncharacterized protein n=1 Tax=termite gut metagenome TaxID=433724 RepID=A0A5J4SGM7_9ZZZZ